MTSTNTDPAKRFTFIDKRELASVVGDTISPVGTENVTVRVIDVSPAPEAVPENTTETTIRELYRTGLHIDAVTACAPNTVILEPLRRPETSAGGIVEVVDANKGTLGVNCLAYRVLMVGSDRMAGDIDPASFVDVVVGDVVVVRNGMLEPLHPNLEPLSIHRMHVLAKINLVG
jgi:hypothetical protein